jgi:signal transduction histidine kinase
VSVSDRGIGIPYEDLDAVFTPFQSTKETGMGMGLSISRSIVEAHDGQIWVTRNPDKGVTFHFTLPLARSTEHGSAKRDSFRG